MVLDNTYFIIFAIVVSACLLFGLVWIGYKKKKRWIVVTGIIVSLVLFMVLTGASGKVYVFTEEEGVQTFRVLGSHTWKLRNGGEATAVYHEIVTVTIINNSDREIILEEVIYSTKGWQSTFGADEGRDNQLFIEPYSLETVSLPHNEIEYFFEDEIPETYEKYGGGSTSKYWLHD